jgi:hypothetical protein
VVSVQGMHAYFPDARKHGNGLKDFYFPTIEENLRVFMVIGLLKACAYASCLFLWLWLCVSVFACMHVHHGPPVCASWPSGVYIGTKCPV